MKIYTSCFSRVGRLPDSIVPISICGRAASWYQGTQYKALAPKYQAFVKYQRTRNRDEFSQRYREEVLASLCAEGVVRRLSELSGGKDIALICHEEPGAFCHRHLAAEWLTEKGYPTAEWEE